MIYYYAVFETSAGIKLNAQVFALSPAEKAPNVRMVSEVRDYYELKSYPSLVFCRVISPDDFKGFKKMGLKTFVLDKPS